MPTFDPTYPLYPIACVLSAAMLLLVLLTSLVRQNWNFGVASLCFWLFFENLTEGVNAILWSDNADVKLSVYCDIFTHMQVITFVVKPMATLIITRRLYLITRLRSVELPNKAASRGLSVGHLVKFSFAYVCALNTAQDYVVQQLRFQVFAASGCQNAPDNSVLGILLIFSWAVVPPMLSITFYYPKVIRILYHQKRDMHHFLQTNNSVSRINYVRIFALASIDVVLTLPIGIATIVLATRASLSESGHFPLYSGWDFLHWGPVAVSYDELKSGRLSQQYFTQWTSPALAFAIFGLFGVTAEARESYWRVICAVADWFGWKPTPNTPSVRSPMGTMEFNKPEDFSHNLSTGYVSFRHIQPFYQSLTFRNQITVELRQLRCACPIPGHSE
ncbi:hypothetical protein PENSPDRAFT_589982 [Peniophora sp. CONT]|nr:hypothetical protein PENSPDRAFT_589982 [Peniophora sp. CONT]